ncbi:MAG: hypothetical protein ACHQLQ_05885, partial [Candidatus Acidiferrales bacterium]
QQPVLAHDIFGLFVLPQQFIDQLRVNGHRSSHSPFPIGHLHSFIYTLIRRLPHRWVFSVFDFAFFLFVILPPPTVHPVPLPFTPQFSPFPAKYLTNPYWHAILSRVCLH